jgi:hypothetical protein
VLGCPGPVRVLAEHDPGLLGVKVQTQCLEPLGDRSAKLAGLVLAVAVDHDVIRVALERAARVLPGHPAVERPVHEQVGQDGQAHAPNALGNFCFDVTLGYRRLEKPRRAAGDWRQVR